MTEHSIDALWHQTADVPRKILFILYRCPKLKETQGISLIVGLGGLEVTCSPRDPRFAGSNPAEIDEFFQDVKILSTSPPGAVSS